MQIEKVTYQKAFAIGPFLQEKIGVEIQLDGPETPEQALDLAKKIVEDWHRENNPHLDHSPSATETTYNQLTTKEVNLQHEAIEIAIDNAQSIEELIAMKPSCSTPQLMKQYSLRVSDLLIK